jgi:hypothetical protein
MEKISGIIPNSSRVAAVDLKEAPPVRPGTPGFGRAEGVSSLRENAIVAQETAPKAAGLQMDQMDWRSKDLFHAKVAQNVTENFFGKNNRAADAKAEDRDPASVSASSFFNRAMSSKPAGFKSQDIAPIRLSEPEIEGDDEIDIGKPLSMSEIPARQPEGLYPKGSFINRVA